jgi:diguanylate cyclase (GGDEF)-like protein
MQKPLTKDEIKIAILRELAQASGRELNKLNLLGNYPGVRGPIENRLDVTFDKSERALAAQAFEELKRDGLSQAPYSRGQTDPENWVEITDAGSKVLQTGILPIAVQVADPLTAAASTKFGIPDHVSFVQRMEMIKGAHEPVSLLFFDLDNFKAVNDIYNHSVGDQVIHGAITIIQEAIHGKGELFHRGGDEFLILLPTFDEGEAYGVAERVRKAVQKYEFPVVGSGTVTATLGLATYPTACPNWQDMEIFADEVMLVAKKRGNKNSVALHGTVADLRPVLKDTFASDRRLLRAIADQLPYAQGFTIGSELNLVLMFEKLGLACSETDRAREIFAGMRANADNWSSSGGVRAIDLKRVRSYLIRESEADE